MRAPLARGIHRLNLRPVIDGTVWLEDQGVFWIIDGPLTGGLHASNDKRCLGCCAKPAFLWARDLQCQPA